MPGPRLELVPPYGSPAMSSTSDRSSATAGHVVAGIRSTSPRHSRSSRATGGGVAHPGVAFGEQLEAQVGQLGRARGGGPQREDPQPGEAASSSAPSASSRGNASFQVAIVVRADSPSWTNRSIPGRRAWSPGPSRRRRRGVDRGLIQRATASEARPGVLHLTEPDQVEAPEPGPQVGRPSIVRSPDNPKLLDDGIATIENASSGRYSSHSRRISSTMTSRSRSLCTTAPPLGHRARYMQSPRRIGGTRQQPALTHSSTSRCSLRIIQYHHSARTSRAALGRSARSIANRSAAVRLPRSASRVRIAGTCRLSRICMARSSAA